MNTGAALWSPPPDARERTRVGDYLRWLKETRKLDFTDYDVLWKWSVTEPDDFWRSVWDYFAVQSEGKPAPALAERRMPGARWFPGAALNYAEHALRYAGEGPAVFARSQTREGDVPAGAPTTKRDEPDQKVSCTAASRCACGGSGRS